MKDGNIAVIGRVADGAELLDGQTVKTRILRDELKNRYPDRKVMCVDTYHYAKRLLFIVLKSVQAYFSCEHVLVLLSRNGRRFLFPILFTLNKIFHRRMYHDVIGGSLADELQDRPGLLRYLNLFEVNWVETEALKKNLEKLGVKSVELLPNFKRLKVLKPEEITKAEAEPYIFVTFSRITPSKGIKEAMNAVENVNRYFGRICAVLYVYGQVEKEYQEEFASLLNDHKGTVFYKGTVPYWQSVTALKACFVLLFPSTYPGEGIPGTLIDAFSAGLPVIASDWHYNSELVREGETGFCYPWAKPEILNEKVIYVLEHPEAVNGMRINCLKEAQKYTPDALMNRICTRMENSAANGD